MKILVADDAVLFRRVIADVAGALPDSEIVGMAATGRAALQKARSLKPDLLLMDMEMPDMDGIAVLEALGGDPGAPAVIVISAPSERSGKRILEALQKGAFDFITKPDTACAASSREALRAELEPRLRALALRLSVRGILRGGSGARPPCAPQERAEPAVPRAAAITAAAAPSAPELLLIGVSTGGPNALATLLPALPADLGVPVLIVQHMPPVFTGMLAENLAPKCALRVCEAADGMCAAPGTAYIAPGGRHMSLAPLRDGSRIIRITDDAPENNCRPAVDRLFRSVADNYPGRSVAVILTGMGSDGTQGLRQLRRGGCYVIAQDEASCVVYGMPKSAVEAGVVDAVLPLHAIAGRIVSAVRGGR